MSNFDDRKNMAEKKFALTAEQEFRVDARRNKLLGIWAAKRLGKQDDEVKAYYIEVIKSDMEEPGDEDVFRKVKQDFISAGVELTDEDLRGRMDVFLTEARTQITDEAEG